MKKITWLLCACTLLILGACKGKTEDKHIQFKLEHKPDLITDFLYVKMDYTFSTDTGYQVMNHDLAVFVHLWRLKSKEMLVQDDHLPVKPTSQWQSGETIRYSRTIFIPKFLNEYDTDFEGFEPFKLTIGLWDPKHPKDKRIVLLDKKINMQPVSSNSPEIIYDHGWYDPETDLRVSDPNHRNWRWTAQKAICTIENPKKPCTLIIRGGVDKSVLPNQHVVVKINDTVLEDFLPEDGTFERTYTVTAEQMGKGDNFALGLETDKTFVPNKINPSSLDKRELGFQLYFLYFREKL
jgi:hypothetical protein